jgi:hypothetical protein
VGNSVSKDSNAFKKIQKYSKLTSNAIIKDTTNDTQVFAKINNLYSDTSLVNHNSYFYGTKRQHNHASLDSLLPSFSTLIDKKGLENFCNYSINISNFSDNTPSIFTPLTFFNNSHETYPLVGASEILKFNLFVNSKLGAPQLNTFFFKTLSSFYNNYSLNTTSDSKINSNS